MKLTPISGDLAVKLALVAGGLGLAWWLTTRATKAAGSAAQAVRQVADATVTAVNPADPGNLVNRAVTAAGATLTGDQNFTVGGWVYDMLHPSINAGTALGTQPVVPPSEVNLPMGYVGPVQWGA